MWWGPGTERLMRARCAARLPCPPAPSAAFIGRESAEVRAWRRSVRVVFESRRVSEVQPLTCSAPCRRPAETAAAMALGDPVDPARARPRRGRLFLRPARSRRRHAQVRLRSSCARCECAKTALSRFELRGCRSSLSPLSRPSRSASAWLWGPGSKRFQSFSAGN